MPESAALTIANTALYLRSQYPNATALETIDCAMEGSHGRSIDFGELADPREPFGQLVIEAFDRGMTPTEWTELLDHGVDERLQTELMRIHAAFVLARFTYRYALTGRPPAPEVLHRLHRFLA